MKRILQYAGLALLLAFEFVLAQAANAQVVTCPNNTPQAKLITASSYTIGQADRCMVLTFTGSGSPISVTLPAPGTHGGYLLPFWVTLYMEGTGHLVVTPANYPLGGTAPKINGASSMTVTTTNTAWVYQATTGDWYAPFTNH